MIEGIALHARYFSHKYGIICFGPPGMKLKTGDRVRFLDHEYIPSDGVITRVTADAGDSYNKLTSGEEHRTIVAVQRVES